MKVSFTPAAQARFAAMRDPRWEAWGRLDVGDLRDVELARVLGRETLPWTVDIGWVMALRYDIGATLADEA